MIDLSPEFAILVPGKPGHWHMKPGLRVEQAQGVLFLCPRCFEKNGGEVGTHSIMCWFAGRGVPDAEFPKPGRWQVSGTGFDDLTLTPSVNLPGKDGCQWHGFIQRGQILNA